MFNSACSSASEAHHCRTPNHRKQPTLLNNGVSVSAAGNPKIFRQGRQPQVMAVGESSEGPPPECSRVFHAGARAEMITTSGELGRIEISTVRHLQRALQSKLIQATRPGGVQKIFHKFDRKRIGSLDLQDLQAAVLLASLSPRTISTFLHCRYFARRTCSSGELFQPGGIRGTCGSTATCD